MSKRRSYIALQSFVCAELYSCLSEKNLKHLNINFITDTSKRIIDRLIMEKAMKKPKGKRETENPPKASNG